MQKDETDIKPYIIGDSLIYDLHGTLVQVGPISVKDLSIHDVEVPEVIIFRPTDYLTIEFNFFHLFFIHQQKLTVYALKDQIVTLKKMMQISLFTGEKDWAEKRLYACFSPLDDPARETLGSYLAQFRSGEKDCAGLKAAIEALLGPLTGEQLEEFRIFCNLVLAEKAFAIQDNDRSVLDVEELCGSNLCFVEYKEGSDITIDDITINIIRDEIIIFNSAGELHRSARFVRKPTEFMLNRFPPDLITDLVVRYRHKLVENGISQIGSGDGMAYTPNQDTSCTLIRQSGKTYLLDASIQSVIKSAYLGINVYEDDIIALLTHGCHGDHGSGLYLIASIRKQLNSQKKIKVYCHPVVLENYIEKCAYVYQIEHSGGIDEIKAEIRSWFEYVEPEGVVYTPFNTHSVPTTGFYFPEINFYVTGDMSGAELMQEKVVRNCDIFIPTYYLPEDLARFDEIKTKALDRGFMAIECGHPPIHIPRDMIVELIGGEERFEQMVAAKRLFLYHTSGQEDASEWVVC